MQGPEGTVLLWASGARDCLGHPSSAWKPPKTHLVMLGGPSGTGINLERVHARLCSFPTVPIL